MRSKRVLIAVVVLAAAAVLVAVGLIVLTARVRSEVSASPPNWDVSATPSAVEIVWGEGAYGVWLDCDVTVRSIEVPSFVQLTDDGAFLGWREPVMGGIHDWRLFDDLDGWDPALRRNFLKYFSARGNPSIMRVDWLGAPVAFDQPTLDDELYKLAQHADVSRDRLVVVSIYSPETGDVHDELIGAADATGGFVKLADLVETDAGYEIDPGR
ncbi:MAG: hypothetical protein CVT59_05595 [Actinobacteria bacterium HGW-Actinobacteria-1]|jgi:hypothetical protein|nr:MAG: hypothetical protein CVT59_05595 [Actinobacteria bacterium HGW-Actinobacteria-1]